MSMKLIETYSVGEYREVDVFLCDCGRQHHVESGGDIAFCECEFDEVTE